MAPIWYRGEVSQQQQFVIIFFIAGNKDTFSHREFSFTLEGDVYVRYQSFESRDALEEGIRKAMPYKIDIGAIFSVKVTAAHLLTFLL